MKGKLVWIISLFLALIPFFWIRPGQVDLGGDASRVYFYDPVSYLLNFSLYYISPQGIGPAEPNFFSLPFLSILIILKTILQSPYLIITLFNSFKIVAAFLSMYFIFKEILPLEKGKTMTTEYAAILGGLFYIFTPTMTGNWDRALLSHNQVFINPLVFFLIFKFIKSKNQRYLWILLLVTFLFSNSFSYTSAPPFFAFFPLAMLFLFLYTHLFKISIPYKKLLFGLILFLGLQSFHLIPQIISLLDPSSYTNMRVFDKAAIANEGVRYFLAILPLAKVSNYVLLSYGLKEQLLTTFVPFATILIGFLLNKKIKKVMLLVGFFYLITLFLLGGNITTFWTKVYERLFYLPGFSMFRNFIGQWLFVFSFFNAILFGLALYAIFSHLRETNKKILTALYIFVFILTSWYFIDGSMVNKVLFPNTQTKIAQTVDNSFLLTLDFIKNIPTDSKLIVFPFTDAYYQVVPGAGEQGVYIGPSLVSYIAGKKDFVGYQVISPFSDVFLSLVREKKYEDIKKLFGILDIHYILWNDSKFVLDNNNEPFLYGHVGDFFPDNQKGYSHLISNITAKKVYTQGSYEIFHTDEQYSFSHIYLPSIVTSYSKTSSVAAALKKVDKQPFVIVPTSQCNHLKLSCENNNIPIAAPSISFKKINPTKYKISVTHATKPYILVFSEAFHPSWKLYFEPYQRPTTAIVKYYRTSHTTELKSANSFDNILETLGKNSVADRYHIEVNGYANAWEIFPQDVNRNKDYTLVLELNAQRYFYLSIIITTLCVIIFLIWGYRIFLVKHEKISKKN